MDTRRALGGISGVPSQISGYNITLCICYLGSEQRDNVDNLYCIFMSWAFSWTRHIHLREKKQANELELDICYFLKDVESYGDILTILPLTFPALSQIYHHWKWYDKVSEHVRKGVLIGHDCLCIVRKLTWWRMQIHYMYVACDHGYLANSTFALWGKGKTGPETLSPQR